MSQNFVHDDSGVVPYINLFDAHSWHLAIGINGGLEKKKRQSKKHTSAIIILRNALAIDASTPTISKSTERLDSR